MASINDVRQYIEENQGVYEDFVRIGEDLIQFIDTEYEFRRRFFTDPSPVRPHTEDRIVFVGSNINLDRSTDKFRSKTLIENVFILGDVHFHDVVFNKNFTLTIEDTYDASLSFTNCHFMGKLKVRSKESNDYEKDIQNKIKLKSLKFVDCTMVSSDPHSDPYLRVGFLDVDKFVLKNLRIPNNAEVNIGDCHFKNFRLSNFRNLGKFKLYRINVQEDEKKSNGTFQIDNTSIGDTDFQSLNLVSFKSRKIFDNILSGINYTNVQWEKPETDIGVGQFDSADEIIGRAKKRDTYRTLKNVAQRNNDMQQAFAFYVKEIKWHKELLAETAKIGNFFYLRKSKALYKLLDRVTLAFGCWTNNYGQNWMLPIFWILSLGFCFYIVLSWLLPGNVWVWEKWDKFFLFLNPTHKVEFISEGNWSFKIYFIDILFRVLEGSLIYQSIQAFRKYARRF